jgi:hypothetical protein
MTSLNTTQRFFNSKGQSYAHITPDGILVKNEKQKDRLNILDRKGYAIDVALSNQAIEAGATELEIKETTLTGSQRIYRASLTDLKKYSKVVTLAGIPRYAFSLAICTLVSGLPEEWQIIEHARWLTSQSEAPKSKKDQPFQYQQDRLFDKQELQDLARRIF